MTAAPRINAHLSTLLERILELPQLEQLVAELPQLTLSELTGAETAHGLASSIVDRCHSVGAIEALCDAVTRFAGPVPELDAIRHRGHLPSESLSEGDRIDEFELRAVIGRSEHAVVFEATREGLRYRLKVPRAGSWAQASAVHRYLAESHAAARLKHPALPTDTVGLCWLGHPLVQGETLTRSPLSSGQSLLQLWPVIEGVVQALVALHDSGLVHGALSLSNVLVPKSSAGPRAILLDTGGHHLWGSRGWPMLRLGAPERVAGGPPTVRSDLFELGLLLHQMLAGRPAFAVDSTRPPALAVWTEHVAPLSSATAEGVATPELDAAVGRLLARDPAQRPESALETLESLQAVLHVARSRRHRFAETELDTYVGWLLEKPDSEQMAKLLEESISRGASPERVGQAFELAAEELTETSQGAALRLYATAGRIYERIAQDLSAAARCYEKLARIAPDVATRAARERLYERLGDRERLIELLVNTVEEAESSDTKARAFSKLGRTYEQLGDVEQALFAHTHALCLDPEDSASARAVERVAGADPGAWAEVLDNCNQALAALDEATDRGHLVLRMAEWYRGPARRPDLALRCFQARLLDDAGDDAALRGMAELYELAHQWKRLVAVLVRRAAVAVSPRSTRDLEARIGEIYERHLSSPNDAIQTYERVLRGDPSHALAAAALSRLLSAADRHQELLSVLVRHADALADRARWDTLVRAAEIERDLLGRMEPAIARLETVVAECPNHVAALAALEDAYRRTGRRPELLSTLRTQANLSLTAPEKAGRLRQVAEILLGDEGTATEAADTLERVVELDPADTTALTQLEHIYREGRRWSFLATTLDRLQQRANDDGQRARWLGALGALYLGALGAPHRAVDVLDRARSLSPKSEHILSLLAQARERVGNESQSVAVLEELAGLADEPLARASHLEHAARLEEAHGRLASAIALRRRALSSAPDHREAASGLRRCLLAGGEHQSVVDELHGSIAGATDLDLKADLCCELAELFLDRLQEVGRAEAAVQRALDARPGHLTAVRVQGDCEFARGHHRRAAQLYGRVFDTHDPSEGEAPSLARYALSLLRSGEVERGSEIAARARRSSHDHPTGLLLLVDAYDELRQPEQLASICQDLLDRFGAELPVLSLDRVRCMLADARSDQGDHEAAAQIAGQVASSSKYAHRAGRQLARAYLEAGRSDDLRRTLDQLALPEDIEQRVEALIWSSQMRAASLDDRSGAERDLLSALKESPADRRVFTALIRLYDDSHDWSRVLSTIERAAEVIEDPLDRAKYYRAAANIADAELNDLVRARELALKTVALERLGFSAIATAVELMQRTSDSSAAKSLLSDQSRLARERGDEECAACCLDALAEIQVDELDVEGAVATLERAAELGSEDPQRTTRLAELYVTDPPRFFDRAVATQEALLSRDAYQAEHLESLRRIYTEAKHADAVWCVCQALSETGRGMAEERSFFQRHHRTASEDPCPTIGSRDFAELVAHPKATSMVTKVLAAIEPAIIKSRGAPLSELGYSKSSRLDARENHSGLVPIIEQICGGLGLAMPELHKNPNLERAFVLLRSREPAIALGSIALRRDLPERRSRFALGAHLALLLPGFRARLVLENTAALKAWFLASVQLIAPRFPAPAELAGAIAAAGVELEEHLPRWSREALDEPIQALFRTGASVDVAAWLEGVELTSDRLGFIMANDLHASLATIRDTSKGAASLGVEARSAELLRYAVSADYIGLRGRTRSAIDAPSMLPPPPAPQI